MPPVYSELMLWNKSLVSLEKAIPVSLKRLGSEDHIYDELTEPIRYSLERCDRVSNYVITIDRNTGYGGIFNQISEYLIEETPKATKTSFSLAEDITSEEVACNASLSLASALNYTNMHTVLTLPEKLPNIIDPARFKPSNLYEMTALLSIPFTSALCLKFEHSKILPNLPNERGIKINMKWANGDIHA